MGMCWERSSAAEALRDKNRGDSLVKRVSVLGLVESCPTKLGSRYMNINFK